jgi:hypothetical protein
MKPTNPYYRNLSVQVAGDILTLEKTLHKELDAYLSGGAAHARGREDLKDDVLEILKEQFNAFKRQSGSDCFRINE